MPTGRSLVPVVLTTLIGLGLTGAAAGCHEDVSPFSADDRNASEAGTLRRLTFSSANDRYPTWSLAGDSVYYSAQDAEGFSGQPGVLVSVPRDGGAASPVLTNVQITGGPVYWLASPAVSPAGDLIAFVELGELWDPDLPVCPAAGLTCDVPLAKLTAPPLRELQVRVRDLTATTPLDDDPALFVTMPGVQFDPTTQPRTYIVHDYPFQQVFEEERAAIFRPSWAPDGQRIAYSDGLRLLAWTVGAPNAEPVPGTEDATEPAWSPDGGLIAFTRLERADSARGFCVATAFGDVVCQVDRTNYSPGRRLLGVVQPDGGGLTQLGEGEEPAWTPDGAELYFRRADQIWRSAADGSNAVPVPMTQGGREPAIAPDGRHLAFARLNETGDYDIWVLRLDSQP